MALAILFLTFLTACGSGKGPSDVPPNVVAPGGSNELGFSWTRLPVTVRLSSGFSKAHRDAIESAAASWGRALGRPVFDIEGDDDRLNPASSMEPIIDDDENGMYMLERWDVSGRQERSLAFTSLRFNGAATNGVIISADVFFNSETFIFGDAISDRSGEPLLADMETTALHELGHVILGPTHIANSEDADSIMNESFSVGIGFARRRLSRRDVDRLHETYDCDGPACDSSWVVANDPSVNSEGHSLTDSLSPKFVRFD